VPNKRLAAAIDTRSQFYDVWNVYWPIALAVFLVVLGLLVFIGLRYRARSHADEIPTGRDENQPLEIGYAIGLACVAGFLVFLTFSHMPGSGDSSAGGRPLAVKVTGARWNWRFEYPEYGIVEQGTRGHVPVLRVPVDTEVDFEGRSIDVIHSFWIPAQRFKRDVFPTFPNRWEMVFDKVEDSPGGGACAEFCGLEHWDMVFNVLAMPRAAFARWARGAAGGTSGEGASA
jgi:cytochrome c oxidase subunit 2